MTFALKALGWVVFAHPC